MFTASYTPPFPTVFESYEIHYYPIKALLDSGSSIFGAMSAPHSFVKTYTILWRFYGCSYIQSTVQLVQSIIQSLV
jgi:hypothetical protein